MVSAGVVVFSATAGYAVAVISAHSFGRPTEAATAPILAWQVGEDGRARPVTPLSAHALVAWRCDIPNFDSQAIAYEDGAVIQMPNGNVISETGKRWETLADWLAYQQERHRKLPPKPISKLQTSVPGFPPR